MLNGVRVDSIFYFLYTNEMLVMDDNEMVASKVWWSSTFKMNNMLKANYVVKVMILINQSRRLFRLFYKSYTMNILEKVLDVKFKIYCHSYRER